MKHIYWVGIKESEIRSCSYLFDGSITFIGSGENGNISFSASHKFIINYNEDSLELDKFIQETLHHIINKIPDVSFLCYTPSYIYSFGDAKINKHIICDNSYETLQLLRNKMNTRLWLKRYVPVLPTIILTGGECQYKNLCVLFPDNTIFTIQGCTGAGGIDTYIMTLKNEKIVLNRLYNNHMYLISPFQSNSYSVNVHILFIGDNYYITPASIQVVEYHDNRMIYHGCDFVEYKNISQEIQAKIWNESREIAQKIQLMSYKGVLGIDYLVSGSEVYFLEINPRFQSSTPILNLALKEHGLPSIQEIVLNYYYKKNYFFKDIFKDLVVRFSNYIIDYQNNKYDYQTYIQTLNDSQEITELIQDGYCTTVNVQLGASIFSITCCKNIVSLNPNGYYYIYDNIKPYLMRQLSLSNKNDCRWLKFAIMNQGISFSNAVKEQILSFQRGVYSSFDVCITEHFIINAPTEIPFHSLSPFRVDLKNEKLALYYGKEYIANITIYEKKKYCSQYTKSGINFQRISFIATDRLRIHHSPNCLFQARKNGCKFCDVPGDSVDFDENDIKEVIDWHLKYSNFRHILIGGASGDYPQEYERILRIVQYIRIRSNKPIYIMTLPPKDCTVLDKYFTAGVNEIAFNIEIYNREYAKKIMPGKGQISLETYKRALLHSVKLWGNTGNVRSLLVYGLENDNDFLEGIEWLASNGIQPIISPFRPLSGTAFANVVPPNTEKLIEIYLHSSQICRKYHLNLGPDCIYCQNNTLSFDSCVVLPCDS